MVRLLHRWVGGAVRVGLRVGTGGVRPPTGRRPVGGEAGGQAAGEAPGETRRDPAAPEAELDQRVERRPAAAGGAEPGVDDRRVLGEPGGHAGVPQVRGRAAGARPGGGRRRRSAGLALGQGPGGTAPGQHAGGDGVVDALAGHRVDQGGGVADQQHRAVGLVPAPARERQVVAEPADVGRRRRCPGGAARAARAASPARAAPAPTSSPYPTLASPSPRSNAQAYDGWRRSPYRITWRPRQSGGVGTYPRIASARRAARGEAQRGPDAGVRAVGADQHAGRWCRRRAPPGPSATVEPADPAAAQHGAGGDRARDEPGVEDRARHHPGGPRHPPGHGVPVAGVAAADLEAAQRRPAVDHVAGADLAEHVDGVRGDPVAAGLVAGEVGAVEQQHPQRRVGARARRGRRPTPAGPAPTTTRSQSVPAPAGGRAVIGPTPARRRRRRRSRPRPGTAPPRGPPGRARPAPRPAARPPPAGTGATSGAKTRSTTVASTSAATASSRVRVAPSRCGSPRTPVAASSARSGSTLTRCAPTPSSAPPGDHPRRRAGRRSGRPRGRRRRAAGRRRRRRAARTRRWT